MSMVSVCCGSTRVQRGNFWHCYKCGEPAHQEPVQFWLQKKVLNLESELERLKTGFHKERQEVEQIIGKALGYPWFKDDQVNFPGATESDGVCTGEHVTVTLAMEVVAQLEKLKSERDERNETVNRVCRERDRAWIQLNRLGHEMIQFVKDAEIERKGDG